MNGTISIDEFENKIKSIHSGKYFSQRKDVDGKYIIYVLDSINQCYQSSTVREQLASHIWKDGSVVKDIDGIFTPVTLSGANYQYHYQYNAYAPIDLGLHEDPTEKTKCECGAHKVGSNNHSSWCAIKETI